ncbi:hypothetical protein ONZ45_g12318 [Pleurotus djamor]|nr:hypothetical protein ONZ45_g12318 [Pleurotus djamor]
MPADNILPIHDLENERVFLTPFITTAHAQRYVDGGRNNHELYQHLSVGPFESVQQFTEDFLEGIVKGYLPLCPALSEGLQ